MKRASTSPEFERLIKERLSAYADQAPTAVRSTAELTFRPVDERRQPRRRIAAIGAAIVALGGGLALTTIAATGGDDNGGGKSTPEAAVEQFVEALTNRDILGALDVLDPAESGVLVDAVSDAAAEGKRVGLFSNDVSLSHVAGASVSLDGLVLSTDNIATDLAVVHLDEGLLTIDLDVLALPVSDELREHISADDSDSANPTINFAEKNYTLASVQRDGQWYVSIGYTIAEVARESYGLEFPTSPGIVPEGFATPEEAATAFWTRLGAYDIGGAAATAAPGEGDAIVRYAPLWLPSVETGAVNVRAEGYRMAISNLTFDSIETRNGRRMTPTGFVLDGTLAPSRFETDTGPFDLAAPTLLYNDAGVGVYYLPAGQAVPDNVAGLQVYDEVPDEVEEYGGSFNFGFVASDGTVRGEWSDTAELEGSAGFRYELVDGCTALSGTPFNGRDVYPGSLFMSEQNAVRGEDGVWRSCTATSTLNVFSELTAMIWLRSGSAAPRLPPIEVVDVDGLWFVSPIGSLAAVVMETFEATDDGAILSIDSPIAQYIYFTNRAGLEARLVGRPVADIGASCQQLVNTDAQGQVAELLDDLPVEFVRDCIFSGFGDHELTAGGPEFVDPPVITVASD